MKKKIPSRKFPAAARKIPSRPFPKRRIKASPLAEQVHDEAETPIAEGTREERLEALKLQLQDQLKSLKIPE